MDIVVLLLFVAIFGWWSIWVSLRSQDRKDAGQKDD
jgi:hypothetical protein